MRHVMVAAFAFAGLAACGGDQGALGDGVARDLTLAPVDSGRALNDWPVVRATAPATRTLGSGARIDATWGPTITSRSNKAGEIVTVNVGTDVHDAIGRVVIPAGSTVDLLITEIAPATSRNQADGTLTFSVASATIRGQRYALQGDVTSVPHTLEGRGVGTAEAVKVGIGAAVGAVAGQVIGQNTKSTVIGGAAGAAGGAAVALLTASRDVVVSSGAPVVITLTGALTVSMK